MPDWCEAGRRAKLGGRWRTPCAIPQGEVENEHLISAPGADFPIVLCDIHFEQVLRLGLVTAPFISEAEYRERGGKQP